MQFQTKILLLSFVASVITSMIVVPILRRLKVGQIERKEGPESHLKKQGTPTMGGIIMILVILAVTGFCYYDYMQDELQMDVAKNLIPLAFVTVGFGIIGFIDDFKKLVLKNTKGLSPKAKMIGLLIVAVGFCLIMINVYGMGTDIQIPFTDITLNLPIWLYIQFAIFVMLGTTNAVN